MSVAVQHCIAAILVGLACLPFDIPFTAVPAVVPAVSACRGPWLLGCCSGCSVLFGGPHRVQHISRTCTAVDVECVAARALALASTLVAWCVHHTAFQAVGIVVCTDTRLLHASVCTLHRAPLSPARHRLHVVVAHIGRWRVCLAADGRSCLAYPPVC